MPNYTAFFLQGAIILITIKKANINDAEIIAELGKRTFIETFASVNTEEDMKQYLKENFAIEAVKAELCNSDSMFFIAYSDEKSAAYMKLNVGMAQTEAQGDESMELQRIYVLSQYKGEHIGSKLIQVAQEEAKKRSLRFLWLGVWEHIFTLGTDAQTDFLMRKQIIS